MAVCLFHQCFKRRAAFWQTLTSLSFIPVHKLQGRPASIMTKPLATPAQKVLEVTVWWHKGTVHHPHTCCHRYGRLTKCSAVWFDASMHDKQAASINPQQRQQLKRSRDLSFLRQRRVFFTVNDESHFSAESISSPSVVLKCDSQWRKLLVLVRNIYHLLRSSLSLVLLSLKQVSPT